jgi:hypothetical protein
MLLSAPPKHVAAFTTIKITVPPPRRGLPSTYTSHFAPVASPPACALLAPLDSSLTSSVFLQGALKDASSLPRRQLLSSRWSDLRRLLVQLVPQIFSSVSEMALIGAPSRSCTVEERFCLLKQSSFALIPHQRGRDSVRPPLRQATFQAPVG